MRITDNLTSKIFLSQIHEGEAFIASEGALFIRLKHSLLSEGPESSGIPIANLSNGCFTFASADLEVSFASVKIVSE